MDTTNSNNVDDGNRVSRSLLPDRTSGRAVIKPRDNRSVSRNRRAINDENDVNSGNAIPLIETEQFDPVKPPIAGPEIEDDGEDDDIPYTPDARPGVDESFFPMVPPVNPPRPKTPNVNQGPVNRRPPSSQPEFPQPPPNGLKPGRELGNFPYAPGFGPPGVIQVDDEFIPIQDIPDINIYQHKKTLAQGMMDLALLSANANQLRYVLESYQAHPYYYVSITFISLSLILQVAVGVGLIINSRYNVKNDAEICKAAKISNYTIIGIFLITVVNVFISSFAVSGTFNVSGTPTSGT